MTRFFVGLLLMSSFLVQASQPDLKAMGARARLQEKLAQRARAKLQDPRTTSYERKEAIATLNRVGLQQEENVQASREYVETIKKAANGKSKKGERNLPQDVLSLNTEQATDFSGLLEYSSKKGLSPASFKTLKELATVVRK